jgi:hypothetical protein
MRRPNWRGKRSSESDLTLVGALRSAPRLLGATLAAVPDRLAEIRKNCLLCLPETTSSNNDDEVRRGSAQQRAGGAVGSADGPVPADNYIRQY